MRSRLTVTLCVALLIPLAGCNRTVSGGTEPVCSQWRYITWSAKDTPETVDGVKASNARRKSWCD